MPGAKYNFTIDQGTTVDFTIQYKDDVGNPLSLEGYSAQMQFRPSYADDTDDKLLVLSSSLDTDGTGLKIAPTSGSINVYISAEKSDTLQFNECLYDLEIYSGSYVSRLMEGKVKISKSVTR